ncbi:MAG: hypothetical protein ACE5J4_03435 [Candidatus Aenigmatarchaeota archaeon]
MQNDEWGGENSTPKREVYVTDMQSKDGYKKIVLVGEYNKDTLEMAGFEEIGEKDGIPVIAKIES